MTARSAFIVVLPSANGTFPLERAQVARRGAQFVMKRVEEWILHLGAHKTGTTHAQNFLAENRTALAAQGLDFLPRNLFRYHRINSKVRKSKHAAPLKKSAFVLEDFLDPLRLGPTRVLISEENMIGNPPDLLASHPYQDLESRLEPWAQVLHGRPVKLYLSIRDFGEVLTSAYAQAIRYGSTSAEFSKFYGSASIGAPSWSRIINRIRTVFPNSPLYVWRFERYIQEPLDTLGQLTGCNLPSCRLEIPRSTRTPSADTIEQLRKLNRFRLPVFVRSRLADRLMAAETYENKFSPLSGAEREAFSAQYAIDIQTITNQFPSMLID